MRTLATAFLLALFFPACAAAQTRPCQACGRFYPGSKKALAAQADGFLATASTAPLSGSVIALLVPHAGYDYSGGIAGTAFARLSGNYDTVAVIGTAHNMPLAAAALCDGSFRTPLGTVETDARLLAALLEEKKLFRLAPDAYRNEHSVEVQLPFLQRKLKTPFKLLPVILNTEDYPTAAAIGRALGRALKGRRALIVISSDLSHYPDSVTARRADLTMLAAMESMDSRLVYDTGLALLQRRANDFLCAACGEGAIIAGMEAAMENGADRAEFLAYSNSGQADNEQHSVGYGAMAFVTAPEPARAAWRFSEEDKQFLFRTARTAILSTLEQKPFTPPLADTPMLNLPAAVFVTLNKDGRLRGCVGALKAQASLAVAVAQYARQAAFADTRFTPVTAEELPRLQIEISVLGALHPATPDGIVPGTHGVTVELDGRSGAFLPSVWEQLPDKAEFLSALCAEKAGLPADCWNDPRAKISVFTATSFAEEK